MLCGWKCGCTKLVEFKSSPDSVTRLNVKLQKNVPQF